MAPAGLRLSLDIAAPRPVITPFTLRYSIDENGGQFDACSAESELSRDRILRAAKKAGYDGSFDCVIGMGVPSPNWARAAELGIGALAELGGGSMTIANADMTLVAAEGTAPALFDTVVGELESALPQVFAVHAVLPEPETDTAQGPSEFVATLSPEGRFSCAGGFLTRPCARFPQAMQRRGLAAATSTAPRGLSMTCLSTGRCGYWPG